MVFLGCNSFNANFAVNGSKIAITDLVSTRVACPALPTEQGFQTALSEANSFKLEQGICTYLNKIPSLQNSNPRQSSNSLACIL